MFCRHISDADKTRLTRIFASKGSNAFQPVSIQNEFCQSTLPRPAYQEGKERRRKKKETTTMALLHQCAEQRGEKKKNTTKKSQEMLERDNALEEGLHQSRIE